MTKVRTNHPVSVLSPAQKLVFAKWVTSGKKLITLTLADGRLFSARKET